MIFLIWFKNYRRVLIMLMLLTLFMGFQNCGKNAVEADFSKSVWDSQLSPFCESILRREYSVKGQSLDVSKSKKVSPALEQAINNNSNSFSQLEMVITANNKCLRENADRSILTENYDEWLLSVLKNFSAQKVKLGFDGDASYLERLAQNDPCVLHLDISAQLNGFSCENCQAYPSDPLIPQQKHLQFIRHDQAIPRFFNPYNGIDSESPLVRVAVLDSGADFNHEDLEQNIAKNLYGDPMGLNLFSNAAGISDSGSHGTHVAGLLAARSHNGVGVVGVMGRAIEVLPLVVIGGIGNNIDLVANALYWAAETEIDIVNMSLGANSQSSFESIRLAMDYAAKNNVFIVSAAGNDNRNLGASQLNTYPAMYSRDIEGAVTVGSLDAPSGNKSSFSNYHNQFVDILAPGSQDGNQGLISTGSVRAGLPYVAKRGTSMATPVVAGAAALTIALLKSRGIRPTAAQVEAILKNGSPTSSLLDQYSENGRFLDLVTLIDFVDSDTGISSLESTPRHLAAGRVKVASLSVEKANLNLSEQLRMEVIQEYNNSVAVQFNWYKNNVKLVMKNSPIFEKENVVPADAGVYWVEVVSGQSVSYSKKISISVDGNRGDFGQKYYECINALGD